MTIGILTIKLHLPDTHSLKEKRSRIKPIIARLRREFNLSVAETNSLDKWQLTEITCAMVANDTVYVNNSLQKVIHYIESSWPDIYITQQEIDLIV